MLKFEADPSDLFWQERMLRTINESTSLAELKEIATLLTKLATTRQTAIKGLVADAMDLMAEVHGNHHKPNDQS
jgi:putative heme iron utilization protein